MYAIIEDSGTQFKVSTGDVIRIDRPLEDHDKLINDKSITFDRVLFVGGGDGNKAKVGAPLVGGATVVADVVDSVAAPKLIVEKHNRRKRYHRKHGHRQKYLSVKVTAINV